MIQDIRLHGRVSDSVEYFATVAGQSVSHRYFYETFSSGQKNIIRFFSPGNEFIIEKNAIRYKGNGGSFCEYMFGINQPIKDLIKKEVVNRLVMNGGIYDPQIDHISFIDQTAGSQSYEEVFMNGNALTNYFFFMDNPAQRETKLQQEKFLRVMGKRLKHSMSVPWEDDLDILHDIFETMKIQYMTLFLIKLVNTANKNFYTNYKKIFSGTKVISEKDNAALEESAKQLQVTKYQQERIKIDVIYKYPQNKRLIDEYKDILADLSINPKLDSSDTARLNRIRTLSVRQNIPMEVFLTLDELFLKDKKIETVDEPKYISQTREILEGLFLTSHDDDVTVSKEDILMLLHAKIEALEKRDFGFEGLLLEIGKTCDDHSRENEDSTIMEKLGTILTFFDRCDASYNTLNQLVLMDNTEINEKMLRTVYNNKKVFDDLSPKLFKEIFIDKILKDRYLTEFGRRKIYSIFKGLKEIEKNNLSMNDVVANVTTINHEMKVYSMIRQSIKTKIQNMIEKLNHRKTRIELRAELTMELIEGQMIRDEIPDHIFHKVVRDLFQETAYLNEILPQMIENPESSMRENFLKESGMDRFYIEELERDYFDEHQLNEKLLDTFQSTMVFKENPTLQS